MSDKSNIMYHSYLVYPLDFAKPMGIYMIEKIMTMGKDGLTDTCVLCRDKAKDTEKID